METWSAHHLFQEASLKHEEKTVRTLCDYSQSLSLKGLPIIFTLGHLAKITRVSYQVLRESVNRKREIANYHMYAVKKRSGGRRFIHSVSSDLFRVQQFINKEILQVNLPHPCSFAFHKSGGIRACAANHCGARWVFQYDLTDFFYDVTEIDVYRLFHEMGYRNLLAFELARLCTTTHLPRVQRRLLYSHRGNNFNYLDIEESQVPYRERTGVVGVLPQGAPTSPMLSNLAALSLDIALYDFARKNEFVYTRYADDITISASSLPDGMKIGDIHRSIVHHIRASRFRENEKKTRIAGPGSKKIVLGLLVDGDSPRLSRETYRRIDRHLHACERYGLVDTASHEKFESAFGFYNHLSGLIAYVKDVDKQRWSELSFRLSRISLPWESS